MKVKVEKVTIGIYDCDSIHVKLDGKDTEIAFKKEAKVSQYEGKEIDLTNDKGVFKIKPVSTKKE